MVATQPLDIAELDQPGTTHLVKFTSPHCVPCKHVSAEIEKIASDERFEDVIIWEVDVLDPVNTAIVQQMMVRSVPIVAIFKDGANQKIMVGGAISSEEIGRELQRIMEV